MYWSSTDLNTKSNSAKVWKISRSILITFFNHANSFSEWMIDSGRIEDLLNIGATVGKLYEYLPTFHYTIALNEWWIKEE